MSNRIQDWPLDGLIVGGVIVFSLACLLGSNFMNRNEDYIAKRNTDGFFALKPLKSSYVTGFGLSCGAAVMTYAVLQSGKCLNMTIEENAENQMIGFLLLFVFWGGVLYYVWSVLMSRYWFNKDVFICGHFWQKHKKYKIQDISELVQKNGMLGFGFADGKKYYIPQYHNGAMQLYLAVDSRVLAQDNPICPVPIDTKEDFLNKGIIVNLLKTNEDFTDAPNVLFEKGVIKTMDDKSVIVMLGDEEKIFAANMRSIEPFHGDGTQKSADFVGTWYVN